VCSRALASAVSDGSLDSIRDGISNFATDGGTRWVMPHTDRAESEGPSSSCIPSSDCDQQTAVSESSRWTAVLEKTH
jgi:hypothetical protein